MSSQFCSTSLLGPGHCGPSFLVRRITPLSAWKERAERGAAGFLGGLHLATGCLVQKVRWKWHISHIVMEWSPLVFPLQKREGWVLYKPQKGMKIVENKGSYIGNIVGKSPLCRNWGWAHQVSRIFFWGPPKKRGDLVSYFCRDHFEAGASTVVGLLSGIPISIIMRWPSEFRFFFLRSCGVVCEAFF